MPIISKHNVRIFRHGIFSHTYSGLIGWLISTADWLTYQYDWLAFCPWPLSYHCFIILSVSTIKVRWHQTERPMPYGFDNSSLCLWQILPWTLRKQITCLGCLPNRPCNYNILNSECSQTEQNKQNKFHQMITFHGFIHKYIWDNWHMKDQI